MPNTLGLRSFSTNRSRIAVPKLIRVEAHLDGASEDHFYTGFSDNIEQGGIFITTFDLKPLNSPVEVLINFPDGSCATVQGGVEWIREFNSLVPEMNPGMGIGIRGLDNISKVQIEDYMAENQALFWDGSLLTKPVKPALANTDDIQLKQFSATLGPECDMRNERLFVAGIARDIEEYVKVKSACNTTSPDTNIGFAPSAKSLFESQNFMRLRIIPSMYSRQFHGGFQESDGEHRLFVTTEQSLPVGAIVNIEVLLPGKWRVRATGEVRWIRRRNPLVSSHAAPPGMGIKLLNISESTWQSLNEGRDEVPMCEFE